MFKFFKSKTDPVYRCAVYKTVGCAHVDGPLCDLTTCTIEVKAVIRPNGIEHVTDTSSELKQKQEDLEKRLFDHEGLDKIIREANKEAAVEVFGPVEKPNDF